MHSTDIDAFIYKIKISNFWIEKKCGYLDINIRPYNNI